MFKRYFIVQDMSNVGDGVSFANGASQGKVYDLVKMGSNDINEPVGASVIEYMIRDEAQVASLSVVFNDYSGLDDLAFVNTYEPFTTNDKNIGRKIRQSINAWSAKNASTWPPSYHGAVWPLYDNLLQRLSDGALISAYFVLIGIVGSVTDPATNQTIDLTGLNDLITQQINDAFAKFPR